MICQHCHKNEASNSFLFYFMGQEYHVHLCDECTGRLRQHIAAAQRQYARSQSPFTGWWMTMNGMPTQNDMASRFPEDAGDTIRKRRVLNQLKARLSDTLDREEYEKAAMLRDEIKKAEKEVNNCE